MAWKGVVFIPIAVCVAAGLVRAQTAGGPVLGVAELVDLAMRRNREFLAARERVAEAKGLLRQAGVRPAPALEVEESAGRPLGSAGEEVFSAGYFHTIETFGKRAKRLAAAQKSVEAAEADLADRGRLLALDVKLKYARALRDQQKLQAIRRLSAANREYYDVTAARVREGDAAPLEGQLFLTELSRAEAQQIVMTGSADRALLELRKAVGAAPGEPFALAPAPPTAARPIALGDLQARALRDRPDLRALQRLEEQAAAEEALAHADGKPDVTASVRYSRIDSSFDQLGYDEATSRLAPIRARDHMLSVGVSVLLFPPKRNLGAIEAAQAKRAGARLRREHLEAAIRLDVEAAYRRWQSAASAVEVFNRGVVGQAENNLDVLRRAYALGQLRIFDVLNEQRRLIDTQLAWLDAQAELLEAFAELEASAGGSIQ